MNENMSIEGESIIKNILVATDGSDYVKTAIKLALEIAKSMGARVIALYVIDNSVFANFPKDELITDAMTVLENEGRRALDYVKEEGKKLGIEVVDVLAPGIPYEMIVKHASKANCDLIVMGTMGRTKMDKLLLGSVAEKVIRHATCPVLAVRLKKTRLKKKRAYKTKE
ncbi:MAG: universal stress protein [Candidatus Thermoplasmatota archaeon]